MKLRVAFTENPRAEPLKDGRISIEEVDLEWTSSFVTPGQLFLHQLKENEFDLFEFSISDYMIAKARPEFAHLGWIAIPTFITKPLGLLLNLHVNTSSGVRGYADLKGKRFGVPDYSMTAAVWVRIALRKLHGIQAQDITWYNGRPPSQRHGRVLNIDSKPLGEVKLVNLDDGQSLNDMLQRGEIDAAFGSVFGAPVETGGQVQHVSTVAMVQDLLAHLYRQEGVLPVNHVLVIKDKHLQDDPRLAMRIYEGFEKSKQLAYAQARDAAESYLLFPSEAFAAQAGLFGQDPFPCGLSANRRMLTCIAEQQILDGLTSRMPDMDSLFAEAVRHT